MEDITISKHTGEQLLLYREHLEHLVDERTKEYQRINADLQMEIQERERIEEELLRARKLAEKFITFSSGGETVKEILDIEEVTRSAVSQAMNNIAENSKQAMPDGGILGIRMSNYRREELS